MNFLNFIQVHNLQGYIYLVMFLAMFVDAALTVFAAVFLMSVGAIDVLPGLLVLLLGIFAEQLGFYWLGMKLSKQEWLSKWANKIAAPFDRHLLAQTFRTLLISKFIYGLHRGILLRSGMLKLPPKKFAEYAAYISIIWLMIIGSLGFVFSASYQEFKKTLRFAEAVPLALAVIFLITEWLLRKRLKKEL
jgi:membrane protein DedA with SNARE-associated domain